MKKRLNRIGIVVFSAIMAVSMAACGGKTDGTSDSGVDSKTQQQTAAQMQELKNPDFVYVPSFIDFGDQEQVNFYNMKIVGDFVYYQAYEMFEESETFAGAEVFEEGEEFDFEGETFGPETITFVKQSIKDGSKETTTFELPEGFYMNRFEVDAAGNYVYMLEKWDWNEETEESKAEFKLACNAPDGTQVYATDMNEAIGNSGEEYLRGIVADKESRVYVFGDNKCYLFDKDGKYVGSIDVTDGSDSYLNSFGLAKNGKVYASYYSYGGNGSENLLAELDFEGRKVAKSYGHFVSGYGSQGLVSASETTFLCNEGTSVYEYDMTNESSTRLFNWLDSDLNGQYIQDMVVGEDGLIYVSYYNYENQDSGLVKLTKTDSSQVVKKEVLVIGSLYGDSDLMNAAAKFNKSNDKYRVTVKNYIDNTAEWNENTYSDAITAMNNDIISGKGPDLFDMSNLNEQMLIGKDALEDLTPYLESSSQFKRSDFFEGILDAYTVNGVQYAIPKTFSLETVVGFGKDLGGKEGWTLAEIVDYGKKNPGKQLFHGMTKEYAMYFCMMNNQNAFIDWTKGECNFNSPEFESLLEFVNQYPNADDYEYDETSDAVAIERGDVLLANAYLYNFQEIQMYNYMFQNDAAYIGYPTTEGKNGHTISASSLYAISSGSTNKEGAWAFIEGYLADNTNDRWSFGFSTLKSAFDKSAEEATKVEYLTDENGEQMLDENGEPIVIGGGGSMSYGDGWSYTYHVPTKEEVEQIKELIAHARPANSSNEEIMNIITEEAAPYFQGQKSASDVAAIIQSRIQLYVDENN